MADVPHQDLTYRIIGCAVITYLAATGSQVGLLFNSASNSLEYRRILPPKKLDAWKERIGRYAWMPKQAHDGWKNRISG